MEENQSGHLLKVYASAVESFLTHEVENRINQIAEPEVAKPVLYSLLAGGKRIRPVLALLSAGIQIGEGGAGELHSSLSPEERSAFYAALSLEAIHTYSLIHDDLPAMDDDSMRRGRPSCHTAFSEWEAILAGDALNTFAFELLTLGEFGKEGDLLQDLLSILVRAGGMGGMICGQGLDLRAEKSPETLESLSPEEKRSLLHKIHLKKTAAMMRASLDMGSRLGGLRHRASFRSYGESLGLLFQITDDILDVTSDSQTLGKTAGKDDLSGKLTYPALYGLEESRRMAAELREQLVLLSEELLSGTRFGGDFRPFFADLPCIIEKRIK